jgi:hypothetical protein
MRSARIQVSGRISYRAAIEEYYAQHPTATQEQVRRATGAPRATVRKVFDALVVAGRLKTERWKSARCATE